MDSEAKTWIAFFVACVIVLCFGIGSCSNYSIQVEKAHIAAGHCEGTVPGVQGKAWVRCSDGQPVEAR